MASERQSVAVDAEDAENAEDLPNRRRKAGDTEMTRNTQISEKTRNTQITDRNTAFTVYSDEDEDDLVLDDDQSLGCGWKYIGLCVLLPSCNGLINGFAWSVLFLYFDDMNWPLWHAGLACAVGLLVRMCFQHIQLTFGIWVAVPANLLHLSSCILAVIYTQHEWAILYEIVCLFGLDPTMSIEGIVYDSCKFASSVSRQATSTSLSVMALSVSLAAILGGLLYDFFSWKGIAVMHTSCQGLLLCVLLLQPSIRKSFEDVFCRHRRVKKSMMASPNRFGTQIQKSKTSESLFERRSMPGGDAALPGAVPGQEMAVEEVEDGPEENIVPTTLPAPVTSRKTGRRTESAALQEMLDEMEDEEEDDTAAAKKAAPPADVKDIDSHKSPESGAEPSPASHTQKKVSTVSRGSKSNGRTTVSGRRTQGLVLAGYLDDLEADDLQDQPGTLRAHRPSKQAETRQSSMSRRSGKSVRSTFSVGRRSTVSRSKAATGMPRAADTTPAQNKRASRQSKQSWLSRQSRNSHGTERSGGTGVTGATIGTALTTMTNLVDAGMHFEHHFAINASLRPKIAARAGRRKRRGEVKERPSNLSEGSNHTQASQQTHGTQLTQRSKATHDTGGTAGTDLTYASAVTHGTLDISWWLPEGTRLPAALILFICFASHCSYMFVCSVYALYYREERGWSQALYAGICQSSGEVLAAAAMRIMSSVYSLTNQEEEPSWCITRLYLKLTEKPYDLAWLVFFWACLNACFMLPWVPVAVTAHVLMPTVYAFSSKMAMELCLVYAMGDPDLFMTLQDLARRIEAVGAVLSCSLGPVLYSMVMPNAPFIFTASLCGFMFLLYTVTFCFGASIPEEDEYNYDEYDYDYEEGPESE